ncbi:MAG: hypothetical protein U9N45_03695, partial [Gemmatimonadota bacterium]|nr:hypothetical protein [Gemmatimonadota bacterium]
HELEGIGVYQYRVTALNAKGELISRFSDAVELVVVYNNVNEIAGKPQIEPREVSLENPGYTFRWDVSNVEGAKDAAVEISMPNKRFHNGNGRERDRGNTFFFNPSLGKSAGTFSSNIEGLAGPGRYLFRVIAISPYGDFIGRWSDPETLIVSTGADSDLTIKLAAAGNQIAPPKPQIAASDTDFMLTWDVSSIDRASGITLRAMENNGGSEAASQDEPVFTQALDGARGDWHVNPSQLKGSGDYLLSIAALDENGGIISSWSEPSRLVVKSSPERVPDSPEKAKTASPDTPVSIQDPDETPTAAAGQADQPVATQTPPDGKNLEVVSKNTPVYKTRDPSSREIFTLQKGETLVRILTDGLWYRVYYPQQKQYGWVLSFNVRNIDSE